MDADCLPTTANPTAMAGTPHSYPSWLAADERKADRVAVDWFATLASIKFPAEDAQLIDISNLGCRLRIGRIVSVGTFVTVGIPHFTGVPGWIAWAKGGEMGVDFSHAIPKAVIEEIIRRNIKSL